MTFEQAHRDVIKLEVYEQMKTYRQLSVSGRIIEAWDRDDDGVWHDVTLREQEIEKARRELEKAKRELEKAYDGTENA